MRPEIQDIQDAGLRISGYVHRTPILSSALLDRELGCELVFKCENLQKVGAFKARGAHNAVLKLGEEQRSRGVALSDPMMHKHPCGAPEVVGRELGRHVEGTAGVHDAQAHPEAALCAARRLSQYH